MRTNVKFLIPGRRLRKRVPAKMFSGIRDRIKAEKEWSNFYQEMVDRDGTRLRLAAINSFSIAGALPGKRDQGNDE